MQIVDQLCQSFLVGLVADLPGDQPCKFCSARASTGIGHFLEAKVGGIGEDGGQQQRPLGRFRLALQVREVAREVGPLIGLEQQIRDLHARHQVVGLRLEHIRICQRGALKTLG